MPATLALPAIQTAIIARLKADAPTIAQLYAGALSVFNTAPAGSPFRYLTVGKGTEQPAHTMGADTLLKWGANCTIEIAARSQDTSDLPLLNLISRVKVLFEGQLLVVTGYGSVVVEVDSVPGIFTEVVDGRETRTQPLILRVQVHEGAR
jgi:hypothetical protein